MTQPRTALIIGAGPAGLTAAYELLKHTDIRPIVFEATDAIGGLSQTVNHKGNRIDIGGHRFFSKSDRVMNWWLEVLPLQAGITDAGGAVPITYRNQTRDVTPARTANPATADRVMLIRNRLSRILYLRKFFDYPITLSARTVRNLGLGRMVKIGLSYIAARIAPIRTEKSLEDFYINRFGRVLYETFFKDYTEKVWGIPSSAIKPDWGAQRVKGLSISKAIAHALKSLIGRDGGLAQKKTETSLIERFMYPKLGPGQLWEAVAEHVVASGGSIHTQCEVAGIQRTDGRITSIDVRDARTGSVTRHTGDFVFSSMPVKTLVNQLHAQAPVPDDVLRVANGLIYRDFMTVGVLLRKLAVHDAGGGLIRDNWIYVQERDVKIGRIQVFNNWSPHLVKDADTVWIGLEYFCNEGDDLWRKPDADMIAFATEELERIGFAARTEVLDAVVIRMPKTYPAYYGEYDNFDVIRRYTDGFENLFLIGRNGMHRYNNQDHSMLTAMTAVENIVNGVAGKDNIWAVNVEQEYHEEK